MKFQDVAFGDHKVSWNHNAINPAVPPNPRVLEFFQKVAMYFHRYVQDGAPAFHHIRILKIRLFPGRFGIHADYIQKVVNHAFEAFQFFP